MTENEIATKVIGICLKIHTHLGPGLLESVYEQILAYELREAGFQVETQVAVPLEYKSIVFDLAFRFDIIVNDKVIIELKSVNKLELVHFAQTLTYLKISDKKLGLLINFNEKFLKHGIHRLVNNLEE